MATGRRRNAHPVRSARRKGAWGALIVVVLSVVASISGVISFGTGKNLPDLFAVLQDDSSGSHAPTQTPTTAAVQPSDHSTSPQPSATAQPRPPRRYLTELDPITVGSDIEVDRTAEIAGRPLPHSVLHQCYAFCNDQIGSTSFNLGGRYRTFTATVGVTDDAEEIDQVGAFTVLLDGSPIKTWTVPFGEARRVRVNVAGALRLELQSGRPGTVAGGPADAALAGANAAWGVSNGLPSLAWGSPILEE